MKNKILLLIAVLFSFFSLCSFRQNDCKNENIYLQKAYNYVNSSKDGAYIKDSKTDELDKIYEDFIEAMPEGIPKSTEEIKGFSGIGEVFSLITLALTSGESMSTLLLFLAVGILIALSENLVADTDSSDTSRSALLIILSIPVFNIMKDLVLEVSESIYSGSDIFSGIIPAVTGLLAVGSGTSASALSGAGMSASLGFVTRVLADGLLPLSAMMFSISMVSSFDTGGITEGAAKGIRGIFNFFIGISSLVIIAVVGMQTVVAVSADNLALKSAKYAISGMIPVVGNTVSGALSALIAGVKLLSSSVGAVSVIALLSAFGAPLIRLLFYRFALFLCITVTSFSGGGFGAKFFTSVRGALDTLIAVLASSSLIYIFEVIIITGSIKGAL